MSNVRFQLHGGVLSLVLLVATVLGGAADARAQTESAPSAPVQIAPDRVASDRLAPAPSAPVGAPEARWTHERERPAQSDAVGRRSGLHAFGLNLLVPGLGQRYLNGGEWTGWSALFAGVDAALWLGLTGTVWHRSHAIDSYRLLARGRAGADLTGKDRPFFLQMAEHRSQEAYVEHLLRSRQWGVLSRAEQASRYWAWDSEEAWERYRDTRATSDALSRRRSTVIAGLIAHRLITGIAALLDARDGDGESSTSGAPGGASASGPAASPGGRPSFRERTTVSLEPPSLTSSTPRLRLTVRW